jgi:hypothetical protein
MSELYFTLRHCSHDPRWCFCRFAERLMGTPEVKASIAQWDLVFC